QDREVLQFDYNLQARDLAHSQREGFNTSDVLYLITPDRFVNGDTDNDAVAGLKEQPNRSYKGGRHGGDIAGISKSLDYIADLGFTAIWVNPVLENDMEVYSYHGYSTTDFYKVDPRFGSNEEYRQLSIDAEQKGIKLIMDMILNHCGSEHWFVKDPPSQDWINNGGEYINTTHRRNTVQDIHASTYDKRGFADGWFVRTMPDLNQRNSFMAKYLIQNSIWWVEYLGLAGIRMDTYPYPDRDFMGDWTCAMMREYPELNIVGEEWSLQPAIVSYWQGGKVNHDGYVSCLPSLMDFPNQHAMTQALVEPEQNWPPSGFLHAYEMMALDFLYADPYNLVVFPDNHDMSRFYTQVGGDLDLFKMGLTYFLTTRGIPQLYYGTEILMDDFSQPGDHGIIRTDYPGGWPGDEVNAFTGEGLTDRQIEARSFLRDLLRWRKDNQVIHDGKLMQFVPHDGFYVYFRYTDGGKVMVIMNKNAANTTLPLDRYAEMLDGHESATEIVSREKMALGASITVPGKTALVLELE
ncbi:MAG: alpha-amylase family glycosyl hydrolase, partial [Bacteroidota bacterium]